MKEYKVYKPQCTYDLDLCDMLINSMMHESFSLVRIKKGGRFYFEYDLPAREMRCFSCLDISGRPCCKQMKALLEELHRVYDIAEVVRIGTRLAVYTFEPKSKKSQEYLNSCAKAYGLAAFSHDEYLKAVANKRNSILKKSYLSLAIMFGVFALMFAIFEFFGTWICLIPAGLLLLLSIFNLKRAITIR